MLINTRSTGKDVCNVTLNASTSTHGRMIVDCNIAPGRAISVSGGQLKARRRVSTTRIRAFTIAISVLRPVCGRLDRLPRHWRKFVRFGLHRGNSAASLPESSVAISTPAQISVCRIAKISFSF